MTAEIEIILAALVTRISARDPRRTWHVANWWGDPLQRPEPASRGRERKLSLWGEGPRWKLHWNRDPYPEDLVACLTAPEIGVAGAEAIEDAFGWAIRLGGSSLYLRYGEVE
ncbi:hypothetical protein [Crossiella sp. CA198]|uniref:hypothetical protein n=1 Tax=Crossiella sp. CA198 TaxID=3455607 RepID=UPI003F8D485C